MSNSATRTPCPTCGRKACLSHDPRQMVLSPILDPDAPLVARSGGSSQDPADPGPSGNVAAATVPQKS